MVSTELHGLEITCKESEFKIFSPPSGQTCLEYASAYIQTAGGYIDNENATADCQFCPYRVGDGASSAPLFRLLRANVDADAHPVPLDVLLAEFYGPLGISFDDRWRDRACFFSIRPRGSPC